MQQIKFDSLVTLGAATQSTVDLKLNPAQLYPARLTIDQPALLQIQTGSTQLQVLLSAAQVKQILQSTGTSPTPAQTSSSATMTGATNSSYTAESQAVTQANGPQPATASKSELSALQLMVRLQPTISGDIELTLQTLNNRLQLPLSASQLFDMLRQPPLAAGQSFSTAASQLHPAPAALLVQVSKHDGQLQLQLDGQASFKLPLQQIQGAQSWPEGKVYTAQLQVTPAGQLTLSPVPSAATGNANTAPAVNLRTADQPARPASAQADQPPPLLLNSKISQQLLPLLAQQRWPERLSSQPQPWLTTLATAQTTNPQTVNSAAVSTQQTLLDTLHQQKPALRWQLSATSSHFLLQVQADIAPVQVKLSAQDFSRPLSFQTPLPTQQQPLTDLSKDLWRQLLPLSPAQLDPLADSALLPTPVRQLLQWVRQSQPDGKQVLDTPQLQQQITAAMQFQPLASNANPNTAAGAIALAISMLLGRLASTSQSDKSQQAAKDKLVQLVGQLDSSQSSQLLKQLASHSGQLQAAQIATLEQPAAKPTEQPLFIQLPLQYDSQSRMAELCIAEQESQDGPNGQRQRQWQLTMKFNLGNAGELLAKVTLKQQQISLQFYTDQAATVQMAEKFLPLLKDRLKVQGVEVTEAGCQLGRIPEHLYRQGTSLLQVRV